MNRARHFPLHACRIYPQLSHNLVLPVIRKTLLGKQEEKSIYVAMPYKTVGKIGSSGPAL